MTNISIGLRAVLVLADVVLTGLVFIGAGFLRHGTDWLVWWRALLPEPAVGLVVLLAGAVAALWAAGLYRVGDRWSLASDLQVALRGVGLLVLVIVGLLFVFDLDEVSRLFLGYFVILEALGLVSSRVVARRIFRVIRRRRGADRRVLLVGWDATATLLVHGIQADDGLGAEIVGYLGDDSGEANLRHLGAIDQLGETLAREVVDEVVVLDTTASWAELGKVIALCEEQGKPVRVPLHGLGHAMGHGRVEYFRGEPILALAPTPERALGLATKRVADLVVGLILLVVTFPILVIVGAVSLSTQGRPVLFSQVRVGLHGREFRLRKLRTMVVDAEARKPSLAQANERRGPAFKVDDDPRITPLGRFLRRTSLDELPQIWNVIRGDMSLIGPRPPVPEEVKDYDPWHRRRLSMKPGITGLWQVSARSDPDFDRWVEIDIEYIDRWSLWLDLAILIRTIPAVLSMGGR